MTTLTNGQAESMSTCRDERARAGEPQSGAELPGAHGLDERRQLPRQLRGFGARPHRVGERLHSGKADGAHKVTRVQEVPASLAGEAQYDVGDYPQIGGGLSKGEQAVLALGGRVAPLHELQDALAARLDGEADGAELVLVGREEALQVASLLDKPAGAEVAPGHAKVALVLQDRLEQVDHAQADILSVGAHVLGGEVEEPAAAGEPRLELSRVCRRAVWSEGARLPCGWRSSCTRWRSLERLGCGKVLPTRPQGTWGPDGPNGADPRVSGAVSRLGR